METKTPSWESELWSYLGDSDGEHCPLYHSCRIRQRGDWCLDEDRSAIDWLVDYRVISGTSFDFIESGTCYGELKTIEMLAQKYLKEGEVNDPPVPSELISLADGENPIEVRLVPLKACHGAIWRLNDEWVIQLNKNDETSTRRFALFHEAFHIMAHCKSAPVFKKRESKVGTFNELLADFFAACVLMPKEWVRAKWTEGHGVDEMARMFDVPKSAMSLRLKRLGLV